MPKQSGLCNGLMFPVHCIWNVEPSVATARFLTVNFFRSSGTADSRHSLPRARRLSSTSGGGNGESIWIAPNGARAPWAIVNISAIWKRWRAFVLLPRVARLHQTCELEQRWLLGARTRIGRIEAEMSISLSGGDATARSALQKSVLH